MAQWLVLQDFKSSRFTATSGQVIDDKHVRVSSLLESGLSVIGYSALFEPAIAAHLSQRRINPLTEGDIGIDLFARGLFPVSAGIPAAYTVINSVSDFPAPVGNVITLPAGVYWVNGPIVMGDINIVLEKDATFFAATAFRDQLIWTTGTGPRVTFTGTGGDESYEVRNLSFVDTTGEDLVAVTAQPRDIFFRQSVLVGNGGTLSVSQIFLFDASQLIGATKGFTFTGVSRFLFMRFSGMDGGGIQTGPLLDFGTSTWDRISINDVGFLTTAGQTAITGAVASGNLKVSGRGEVVLARFEGVGTPLVDITVDDLKWLFAANTFIGNSFVIGHAELGDNTTETSAPNTGPLVLIAGTYTQSLDKRFTTSAAGVMTYEGLNPRAFQIQVQMAAEMASGGTKNCAFQVFHTPFATGTPVGLGSDFDIDISNQGTSVGLLDGVELMTGDTLEVRTRNEVDTVNILVTSLEALVTAIPSGV